VYLTLCITTADTLEDSDCTLAPQFSSRGKTAIEPGALCFSSGPAVASYCSESGSKLYNERCKRRKIMATLRQIRGAEWTLGSKCYPIKVRV
jgi:hypothetical protein